MNTSNTGFSIIYIWGTVSFPIVFVVCGAAVYAARSR